MTMEEKMVPIMSVLRVTLPPSVGGSGASMRLECFLSRAQHRVHFEDHGICAHIYSRA